MIAKFISWLMAHTIEAWDDRRDPDWKEVYDPWTDSIRNPTQEQVSKMLEEYRKGGGEKSL